MLINSLCIMFILMISILISVFCCVFIMCFTFCVLFDINIFDIPIIIFRVFVFVVCSQFAFVCLC